MALTLIEQVRTLVGDSTGSPFYPLLTDDQYQNFLDMTNNNVFAAARWAAISISFVVAGWNTRETTGDLTVYNEYGKNYLASLGNLINSPGLLIPSGLFPWSANKCPSKLMSIEVCDGDACREAICCETGCGCDSCHPHGEVFVY